MDSTNTSESVKGEDVDQILYAPAPFSYQTLMIVEVCLFVVGVGSFATFGVVSNIINIIVFYRQGILSSSTNVNLSGLAIADFFTCFFMLARALSLWFVYFSEDSAPPYSSAYSLSILTSLFPDLYLQMTCWITAVTSFERVISVIFPFKVKQIFTPHRSLVVYFLLFIVLFILNTPGFLRGYLAWEVQPVTNASYLKIHYSRIYSYEIHRLYAIVVSSALRFLSIAVVVVCNIILFSQISLSQKFRETATAGQNVGAFENRSGVDSTVGKDDTKVKPTLSKERKLLRMITAVCSVFTICNAWEIPTAVLYSYVWEYNVDFHDYEQIVVYCATCLTEVINSSVNIIIYYRMSSRYKETFDALFKIKSHKLNALS